LITVKNNKDGKIITLSKAFDTRDKILYIIYFAAFTFAGFIFLNEFIFSSAEITIGFILFVLAVAGVYLFAAYKFINKALQTEKLHVTKTSLTISRKGLFFPQVNTFNAAFITNFRHLAKPEVSKHPLAGDSFDYLGFQTEQKVINEMHGDNRLAFDYNGRTIKFGENMYTWDFEQIEGLLYEVTEKDFRIIKSNYGY
jgi:hypothetical protein